MFLGLAMAVAPVGGWLAAGGRGGPEPWLLALAIGTDASDIWIYELERDARTRFSFETASDRQPLWSPDDGRLAYASA